MLDIGFWEIMIIGVVALLVIGPERLPEVAVYLGRWAGRFKAYVSTIKSDIDRELHLQELQEKMKLEEEGSLHEIVEETKSAVEEIKHTAAGTRVSRTHLDAAAEIEQQRKAAEEQSGAENSILEDQSAAASPETATETNAPAENSAAAAQDDGTEAKAQGKTQ